uniref:Uncharacterized protein n=1 Tax=Setaria italica TaxID=4555 RepID=K3ZEC4_SETIT
MGIQINAVLYHMDLPQIFEEEYGGILHPLVFGDYPETMKKIAGSRLPSFSSYNLSLLLTHLTSLD